MGWATGSGWQGVAVVPGTLTVGDAVVVSSATQSGSAAFQAGNFDFNVGAGFGSSTATAPVYGAGVMGNILGSALTATQNILGGVIGKYTITSTNASVLGKAGVIGEVGDLSDTADAAVLAVLGGDTGTSTPGAAFGVMYLNSTAASKFDYGMDLYRAAVGSYQAITYGSAAIRLPNAEWIVGRNAVDSANVNMFRLDTSNQIAPGATFASLTMGSNVVTFGSSTLVQDDTDIMAFKNGTNAQALRVYRTTSGSQYLNLNAGSNPTIDGNYGSFLTLGGSLNVQVAAGADFSKGGGNGSAMGISYASTTVNTTNLAASITATNLIPAGSLVYGVVTRNTVAFNGTMSSFDIGDGTTVDLFANNTSLAAGDTTDLTDHLATFQPTLYPAATSIVVTAVGGTFGTTGTIRIGVFYFNSTAPTS